MSSHHRHCGSKLKSPITGPRLYNSLALVSRDYQRWSPRGRLWPRGRSRGHILKSLALASKPQVLENCPALGSRTALFFDWLKFCRLAEKCFSRPFFFGD